MKYSLSLLLTFIILSIHIGYGQQENHSNYLQYDVLYSSYSLIPNNVKIKDIDFKNSSKLENTLLKSTVTHKLDVNGHYLNEIIYHERNDSKEWMNLPYRIIIDHQSTRTYDKMGIEISNIDHDDSTMNALTLLEEIILSEGFPFGLDTLILPEQTYLEDFERKGGVVSYLSHDIINLIHPNGSTNTIDLTQNILQRTYTEGESTVEEYTKYIYTGLHHYIPILERRSIYHKDGLVIIEDQEYSSYKFHDSNEHHSTQRLRLYISPNPAQSHLSIALSNQEKINSVIVTDYFGAVLIEEENVNMEEVEIDLSRLPSNRNYVVTAIYYNGAISTILAKD